MKENSAINEVARSKNRMRLTAKKAGVKLDEPEKQKLKISSENEQSDII
jgi:hypothetical protein